MHSSRTLSYKTFRRLKASPWEGGYTLAGVLLLIALMSIMMAVALPVWDRIKQRENEEELIFRGKEYIEAIARYHTKFNSYPADLETLQKLKFIRKLYKDPMTESGEWKLLHPDSLVETGEAGFINQPGSKKTDKDKEGKDKGHGKADEEPTEVIPGLGGLPKREGQEEEEGKVKSLGPVVGVVSRSKKPSLRLYNGQSSYDKWVFTYVAAQEPQPSPQPQQPGKKTDPKKQPDKSGKPLVPQPQDQTPDEE
jgi:type II secretory pathway pseudopilin PulG